MDTPSTLGEIIDLAAERHDGASGRRLAELAQADGFTLSHGTVNRLRRGDKGDVSHATIDALAHISGVDREAVLRAANQAGRPAQRIAGEYIRTAADALRLVVEYAEARDVDTATARDELNGIVVGNLGHPPATSEGTSGEAREGEKNGAARPGGADGRPSGELSANESEAKAAADAAASATQRSRLKRADQRP